MELSAYQMANPIQSILSILSAYSKIIEAEVEIGSPFLASPGLIVLPELTRNAMENTIVQLWKQGYFDALKPITELKKSHPETDLISHKIA